MEQLAKVGVKTPFTDVENQSVGTYGQRSKDLCRAKRVTSMQISLLNWNINVWTLGERGSFRVGLSN